MKEILSLLETSKLNLEENKTKLEDEIDRMRESISRSSHRLEGIKHKIDMYNDALNLLGKSKKNSDTKSEGTQLLLDDDSSTSSGEAG